MLYFGVWVVVGGGVLVGWDDCEDSVLVFGWFVGLLLVLCFRGFVEGGFYLCGDCVCLFGILVEWVVVLYFWGWFWVVYLVWVVLWFWFGY